MSVVYWRKLDRFLNGNFKSDKDNRCSKELYSSTRRYYGDSKRYARHISGKIKSKDKYRRLRGR